MVAAVLLAGFGPSGAVASAQGVVQADPTTTTTAPVTTTSPPSSTTTTSSTTTVPTSSSTTSSTTFTTAVPLVPPTTISNAQAQQLKELSGEYEDLTAEELDLVKRIAAQDDQSRALAAQVDQLNAALGGAQRELADAQKAVDAANARSVGAQRRLHEIEQRLAVEEQRLRDQAVEAYIGGGLGGGVASTNAILRSGSVNDLGTTVVYADSIVTDQQQIIGQVRDLRAQADALRAEAESATAESVAARTTLEDRTAAIKAQRDQQDALREQVDANNALQNLLLAEVSQKRADYAQRIALLSAVSDGISGTLAKRQTGQQLPLVTAGIFLPPLPNPTISSPFGPRSDPLLGTARMHSGVDLVASSGTPIRAAADGVVVIASEQGGYGNCTVIDHGSGLGTLYGHQSAFNVAVGDTVKRGQIIGFVGSTGHSTGPHLHWEVRQFGQPVDPLPYMGSG